MGISTYIYLGPYIECEYRVTKREVQVRTCTNTKCENHKNRMKNKTQDIGPARDTSPKFCASCGGAIGPCPLVVEERQEPYEVVGEDVFMDLNSQTRESTRVYLAANLNSKHTPRDFSMRDEDEEHFDLRTMSTEAEMTWLASKYAKEIKKLKTAFDNVEVKWGFHRYYS
jgi:hypothetical protein